MHRLSHLLFSVFHLYYYTNLNSSIICCLSCGDIYLSFCISLLASFDCNSVECNSFEDFFNVLVILSEILFAIKSAVASAVLWIALFEAVFIASVSDV